jgi:hypothetical protein
MTSVLNLFSNFDDLSKKKSINDYAADYKASNNNLNNYSPAMTQGEKFQKYQREIKKNLDKKTRKMKVKEGFDGLNLDNMNLDKNGLALQSHNIITSNEALVQQQSTIQNLRQQYQDTLKEYNDLVAKYTGATNEYINRVSSNNPYLGKNVRFSNGAIFYVTNQGVAKLYPNTDIYNSVNGVNGCPPSGYIQLDTLWDDSYFTPGTIIPAKPDLLVGTPMVAGQSCGNEGKNIFVNTMVSNPKSSYVGCYNDEPLPTLINFAPQMNSSNTANGFTSMASSVYMNNNDCCGPWAAFDRTNSYWHTEVSTPTNYDANTGVYLGNNGLNVTLKNGNTVLVKGEYLILSTPSEYTLNGYSLLGRQDCCGSPDNGRDPNTWYIIGNKTNVGWFEVDYQEGQTFNYQKKSYNDTNSNPYNAYAIIVTVTGGSGGTGQRYCLQIAEWELFTSVASTDNSTRAMIWNPDVIGFVTPEQCQSYATENGYKYYGLQAPNSDGNAACLVGTEKTRSQMYGEAFTYTPVNLWATYTNDGTSASLTKYGILTVYNSSGTSVYSSGTTTASATTPQTSYIGCYNDCTNGRGLPTPIAVGTDTGYDYAKCLSAAKDGNWNYFGLQFTQPSGTSECWVGNDLSTAQSMGTTSNCSSVNGYTVGLVCSNAVYSTIPPEPPGSPFFLILQDDGNMCIYNGTSPSSMSGYAVFCTMTNGKQQAANPQFAASKGKYGQNWIGSGSTLAPGDFIGSTNGNMYLMMQTDGNLVLNTFSQSPACSKNSSGMTVGGPYINALYENSEVGITSNIAKLAYVDENAKLFNYPFDNIKYGNSYSEVSRGMDTPGNDIPGAAYGNATFESCQNTCNNNPDCAGIVTNKAGDVCWPKNRNMYPYSTDLTANSDRIIFIRNQTPIIPPIGVPETTNNIDTIQYQSYVNGGNIADKYGLAKLTAVQKQQLDDKRAQLDLLSQQITNYTNKYGTNSETAEVQMGKNVQGLKGYLTDLKVTDKKITNFGTNVDLILNDSDIVALQKNYDYLFWTILATGTVLVAINIMKK